MQQPITLTEEQIEEIADKAADKAVHKITDHVYQQVGKSIINKLFWIAGVLATAAYLWISGKIDLGK